MGVWKFTFGSAGAPDGKPPAVSRFRVVAVDDSAVLRRLLVETLESDPEVSIVVAPDGETGLSLVVSQKPDVVILDIEMPRMNGLELLKNLRRLFPRLPIVMYSHLTERGSRSTLEALCLGATDYVPKPPEGNGLDDARRHIRTVLLPRLKALHEEENRRLREAIVSRAPRPARPRGAARASPLLLAIGASTGGPNALVRLLSGLGSDFWLPAVIAQHMPPLFTALLAERLTRETPVVVREGESRGPLRPGQAWLAPGDRHLVVQRTTEGLRVDLSDAPPVNSCRPSVDVLFKSVADAAGERAIVVVLTGMGHDGLEGVRALRERGAVILVQDEPSSVVWGMPGAVAQSGLADAVLSLDALAAEVRRRAGGPA